MHKTSVYLTEEESARLALLAEQEGMSQSEVLREAIRRYEPTARGDRNFALVGAGEGPGGSIADLPDSELFDGFGE